MQPIHTAFTTGWADAETVNLLDDGLSLDRARETDLSEKMIDRFVAFGLYGRDMNADGILVTCSAFGPAIDRLEAAVTIPVLRPNEAMFHEAVALGKKIGMLATFAPAVSTMTEEFDEYIRTTGSDATLRTIVVERAIDLLKKGDAESHNRLVAERAPELADCDVIMLAHFSTSRAAAAVRAVTSLPVLTAPDAAVKRMRAMVEDTAAARA
jgi:Asp/Glu/hydantoin racemase